MAHKTIVITGATDGIGKVAAWELAQRGAALILIGRNAEKGKHVVNEISGLTSNNNIRFYQADLSLLTQTKRVCGEIKKDFNHIDILLNNAGGYFSQFHQTEEGLEVTFVLNHLNYFVMTQELLPLLEAASSARIVNVSSDAHNGQSIDWDNIQGEKGYKGWTAYGRTKLMNILFTYELARRIADTSVTANCLHPGFVKTKFGNNNPGFVGFGIKLAKAISAVKLETGAETSVYLSSSPEVEGISGKYFYKCKPKKSSEVSYIHEDWKRLWALSEETVSKILG